jgi:hypothetical protein
MWQHWLLSGEAPMLAAHFLANLREYGRLSTPPAVTACFVSALGLTSASKAVGFSNVCITWMVLCTARDGEAHASPVAQHSQNVCAWYSRVVRSPRWPLNSARSCCSCPHAYPEVGNGEGRTYCTREGLLDCTFGHGLAGVTGSHQEGHDVLRRSTASVHDVNAARLVIEGAILAAS